MLYNFFIDESGDHGLTKIDTDFPVFLLCGVLIKEEDYETKINVSGSYDEYGRNGEMHKIMICNLV